MHNKKYLTSFLIMISIPAVCYASSARYTQLVRQKQQKIEQLEKCMGTMGNLKIAGISTLGLTAVGVAGNIAEAKIISDNESKIDKMDEKIEKQKVDNERKKWEIEEAKRLAAAQATQVVTPTPTPTQTQVALNIIVEQDIAAINALTGKHGDTITTRGYEPEQLPDEVRSRFATAWINFIVKCRSLIGGQSGVADVSLSEDMKTKYNTVKGDRLALDTVVDTTQTHELSKCTITRCESGTNDCIPVTTTNTTTQTDCTEMARADTNNPHAVRVERAKCKDTSYEIEACKTGFDVSEDKKKCIPNDTVSTTPLEGSTIASRCNVYFSRGHHRYSEDNIGYRVYRGAEFCRLEYADNKNFITHRCSLLGMQTCMVKEATISANAERVVGGEPLTERQLRDMFSDVEDQDFLETMVRYGNENSDGTWVCSTDCSVLPTNLNEIPAFLVRSWGDWPD